MPTSNEHMPSTARDAGAPAPSGDAPGGAVGAESSVGPGVRLEALGLLAGGVAHDFNNILAIIRANVELARGALQGPPADVPTALADLAEVERAVGRASDLVRQLLAFGRRQRLAPEPLDLNAVVRETLALVRVLVGDAVRVVTRPAVDLPRVRADRPQMEQVLVSLVLNGRDAIVEALAAAATAAPAAAGGTAGPGTLTVTTRTLRVSDEDAARLGVARAGAYACLQVHDDGIGMDGPTRARIFEPFFTTKAVDRGAGLGLAATWGIVRQSGGAIHVESEVGAGSTFTVYLPATEVTASEAPPAGARGGVAASQAAFGSHTPPEGTPVLLAPGTEPPAADPWDGGAVTVLLAEDDAAVRRATSRILRSAGYQVLEAGDGRSALALWRARASEVALLIADIRMPHLRGDALARAVRAERPDLPVVLITGFGEEPSAHDPAHDSARSPGQDAAAGWSEAPLEVPVLGKPFTTAELLGRVAASLAAARERRAARGAARPTGAPNGSA